MEATTSILLRPFRTDDHSFLSAIQHTLYSAAHETRRSFFSWLRANTRIPASISFIELWLTKRAELADRLYSVFNEANHIYRYIQGSDILPSTRRAEMEKIMTLEGLSYIEILGLMFILVKLALWINRLTIIISKITLGCVHYLWQHFLLDLWRAKLANGFTFLIWGCIYKVWMGRRLEAAGIAIAMLLSWPLCALLHPVIVGSKE